MFLTINLRNIASLMLIVDFIFLLLGGNLFNRKILLLNFLFFFFVNRYKLISVLKLNCFNWALWLVILWCALSSLWSEWFFLSIEETVFQVILVLTCALIANYCTFDDFLICFKKSLYVVICLNLLTIVISPSAVISGAGLVGLTNHKNQLGLIMAVASIFLYFLENKNTFSKVMMFISISLLALSFSKTSIFLSSITIIFAIFLANKKTHLDYLLKLRKAALISLILLTALYGIFLRSEILFYMHNVLDPDSLTGRVGLWLTMLYHAENKLLLGFGFNSVWGKEEYSEIYFTDLFIDNPLWVEVLSASDGGYIDIVLSIGIVGITLFFIFMTQFYFNIYTVRKIIKRKFLFAILFFTSLHNITETTFLLSTNLLWFLFVLFSFYAASSRMMVNVYKI